MFSFENVLEARNRIGNYVRKTPLLHLENLDEILGCQVYVKLECMQKTGAFKYRGAMNKIYSFSEEERAKGFVTASSGNHGRAVANAAKMLNVPAVIVMPDTATEAKIKGIEALGGEVVLCENTQRFVIAEQLCKERNATFIPPYNDYEVMAGQGTAGIEIMEQCPEVDVVITPASGGGLLGGVSTAVKALSNGQVRVYGAEPLASPCYTKSLAAGKRVEVPSKKSVADALPSVIPGEKNFPVVCANTDGVVPVADDAIIRAMKLLLTEGKILAEPSSCIGIAAVLEGQIKVSPEDKVCFMISGGNIGLEQVKELL